MDKIDISICPTTLEDTDGNQIDQDAYMALVRRVVADHWPDARITIQIGHRQGDEWYTVNGRASRELREYIAEAVDWTDEDIWN